MEQNEQNNNIEQSCAKKIHRKNIYKYLTIILGTAIATFGVTNIHGRVDMTEGGVIGMILLLNHFFKIPNSLSTLILDGICYLIGYKILGKEFLKTSIFATLSVAFFYWVHSLYPYVLPDLTNSPLIAAVLGGIFVGVGVSLIIIYGAASGGDDALALLITHFSKISISKAYLFTDLVVLGLSLSYIPVDRIMYSVVTVIVSSYTIGFVENACKGKNKTLNLIIEKFKKRVETVE